jgi:hypothetical protein
MHHNQPEPPADKWVDAAERESLYEFTPEQADALERTRRSFTKADLAEINLRQRKAQALLAKMVDATREEEDRLDREFDGWIRSRNRIMSAPVRLIAVIIPRARNREHRSTGTRRTSSSTSSSDPPPPAGPPPLWRHSRLGLIRRDRLPLVAPTEAAWS